MREILFRGKTKYNEWLYWNEYGATVDKNGSPKAYNIDMLRVIYVDTARRSIIPETVGQFTGLRDENGKRIWEGDVVRIDGKNYEVQYLLGQFFVGVNMPIAYKRFECEVIGNIHDNRVEDFENGC